MARTSHVPFDGGVRKVIAQAADDHGLRHLSLLSGAGHDAQEIAALCPTAMIFVRGEYDGISHNPREYSTPEACAHGVDVLVTTLVRLACDDVIPRSSPRPSRPHATYSTGSTPGHRPGATPQRPGPV